MLTAVKPEEFKADILIVDDVPENIRFLSSFLGQQGYQVRKAINGKSAFVAIESLPPELILLDVNMSEMDGYEVCKALKSSPRTAEIPVIFLSAGNDLNDKVKAFEAGGVDYITKPFQLEEVLVRIETQLRIQSLQQKLQEQNLQLQSALTDLQKAQAKLVQREKMSSVARIVGEISHEINNPLSFILCNSKPACDYAAKLIALLKLYDEEFLGQSEKIESFKTEFDLDFIIEDFEGLIDSIKSGAQRINSVVKALRVFYNIDALTLEKGNIQDCIDDAIKLVQGRIDSEGQGQPRIEVLRKYAPIPLIECHINQLRKAFFNLLENAIESLESRLKAESGSFQPRIEIETAIDEQQSLLHISIRDNGCGISKEDQSCLFEPFFSTKTGVCGVGMGLFISYQVIVEMHKGNLTYQSDPDVGSDFVISLPLMPAV